MLSPLLHHRYWIFTVLIGLYSLHTVAQVVVSGKIVDDVSGEPVLFASIGIVDAYRGTSSNEEGEFILELDSLPQVLEFAHLNYQAQRVVVRSAGAMVIRLKPSVNTLDEVTVLGKKAPNQLVEIVKKAFYKVKAGSKTSRYGKAFYRQKTRTEDEYYELYEIFFDTKYNNRGIYDWAIQEGRYALKGGDRTSENQSYVFNRNFTLLNRVLTTIQPETEAYIMPVHQNVESLYELKVNRIYQSAGRTITVIDFLTKSSSTIPGFNGQLFIDINSYEILKISASVRDNNLKLVKLSEEGTWDDYSLRYEMAFKGAPGEELLLDYVDITQSFDYINSNQIRQRVETKAFLSYYEYYTPVKSKKLGGKIRGRSDAALLDRVGYNQDFWQDNPLIKRTPVEMEVIASFERENSFGTIYLNNKQLIEFDKDGFTASPVSDALLEKFNNSKHFLKQQKSYLHTDKNRYARGETVWYKAYLVDALEHHLQPVPSLLHIELVNPDHQVIAHQQIQMHHGSGFGEFKLADSLNSGQYRLRAYTNWMRNFDEAFIFEKPLSIFGPDQFQSTPSTASGLDLQFFPEGGELIHNVAARVGFKAINAHGLGTALTARIVDSQGQQVAQLQSNALGMGSFFMRPRAGESYFAEVDFESAPQKFSLPAVAHSGFGISVRHINSETIKIVVQTSPEKEGENFYLIGQVRGIIYYKAVGKIVRGSAILEVPKSKFPTGILQLTLFDAAGQPSCERLLFVNDQRPAVAEIDFNKRRYRPREQASIAVKLTDAEGKPLVGNLSLSVTDANQSIRSDWEENIGTYLLLSSDLQGYVESPGYYFQEQTKEVQVALDDLMLTQGWRRFSWQDVIQEKQLPITFSREGGVTISGTASDGQGRAVANRDITMVGITTNTGFYETRTDDSGRFGFQDVEIVDSSLVVFKVLKSGKDLAVNIKLAEPSMLKNSPKAMPSKMDPNEIRRYLEYDRNRRRDLEDYLETKILDEVVIAESAIETNQRFHSTPDVVITPDLKNRSYNNVYEMINGRVPGMMVNGNQVTMRGGGSPLFVIDGLVINESYSVSMVQSDTLNTNIQTIDQNQNPVSYLNPKNIDRIEILRNADAAMYGIRGGNGVIAIYTKGYLGVVEDNYEELRVRGLHQARAFYQPKYLTDDLDSPRPDQRITLYWSPQIITDVNGEASVRFFNSDRASNFEVVIEGITIDGQPIFLKQQLQK